MKAVEFSPIRLLSRLGEPLQAEVDVRADVGDVLTARCLRLSHPVSPALPTLDGLSLAFEGAADRGTLRVGSTAPVLEPAASIGIEANCGGGRVWQELAVLLGPNAGARPLDRPGEWVVAAGESPQSLAALLFPSRPATQRRFIESLAALNPDSAILAAPARALEPGSVLRMPDWRSLDGGRGGAAERPRVRAAASPEPDVLRIESRPTEAVRAASPATATREPLAVVDRPTFLRLATTLSQAPAVTEAQRETLRMEYRLLTRLSAQLATSLEAKPGIAANDPTPPVLRTAPQLASPAPLAPPSLPAPVAASSEPAVPVSSLPAAAEPRRIPQVSAPEPATEQGPDWTLIGGTAVFVLLVLALVLRRKPQPAPVMTQPAAVSMDEAETVMGEPPQVASERAVADFSPDPFAAKPAAVALPPGAIPVAPDADDVNPVIELAEIMLSFGRIHGAAETLREYLENHPKEALLPWMKLLEIYRSGDMHDEFDELATKLHDNFNVEVQHWDLSAPPPPRASDIAPKARTLEEAPHICERVVSTWGSPECLEYLRHLLLDNRGGSRTGFTLPVVQEILLLIDVLVARDASASA